MNQTAFFVLGFCLAMAAAAQTPAAFDPGELLRRATLRVSQSSDNLPRFACTETVERSLYVPRQAPQRQPATAQSLAVFSEVEPWRTLAWTDRLRLDVAVFDGRELFSWPGGQRFHHEDFDKLVGSGASSAGEFGPFAMSVFLSDADPLAFRFEGLETLSGSRVAQYRYRVPRESSHFSVLAGDEDIITGFQGSFWIDAQTADLKRLVLEIPQPPSASGMRFGLITIDYVRRSIGSKDVLLPSSAVVNTLSEDDGISKSRIEYGGCRQYEAESSVRFDIDRSEPGSSPALNTPAESRLPPGLIIKTKLITSLDSNTNFAGDSIEAKVNEAVTEQGRILIPAGAVLSGRIVEMQRRFYPSKGVLARLEFERASFNGHSVSLSLASIGPVMPPTLRRGAAVFNDPSNRSATIVAVGASRLQLRANTVWIWRSK